MISLCHSTARPLGWLACAHDWFMKCDHPENVEYVLAIEPHQQQLISLWRPSFFRSLTVLNHAGPTLVNGFNAAAAASTGNPLVMMADDLWPCEHWDTLLLECLKDRMEEALVVWADNGTFWGRPVGEEPHPLMTRSYYKRYGYVFNPIYKSHFADTEFFQVAKLDNAILDCRDQLKFDHRHFSESKRLKDSVDLKNDEGGGEPAAVIYRQRLAQNFPRIRKS